MPNPNDLAITTTSGPVLVRDFRASSVELNGSYRLEETSTYVLTYFPREQTFVVDLRSSPLSEARAAAERALLGQLNIRSDEACLLRVIESVAKRPSGPKFGLSFCSGALDIPENVDDDVVPERSAASSANTDNPVDSAISNQPPPSVPAEAPTSKQTLMPDASAPAAKENAVPQEQPPPPAMVPLPQDDTPSNPFRDHA